MDVATKGERQTQWISCNIAEDLMNITFLELLANTTLLDQTHALMTAPLPDIQQAYIVDGSADSGSHEREYELL